MADAILERAISLDQGRPADDTTVVVLRVAESPDDTQIRRLTVTFPVT
jgi:hypothetical protein